MIVVQFTLLYYCILISQASAASEEPQENLGNSLLLLTNRRSDVRQALLQELLAVAEVLQLRYLPLLMPLSVMFIFWFTWVLIMISGAMHGSGAYFQLIGLLSGGIEVRSSRHI